LELVNKKFIKLDKFDIYGRLVKTTENIDNEFISNLIRLFFDYEKENKCFIKEFYIHVNDTQFNEIIDINNIPIRRDGIRNAALFAFLTNNLDLAKKLEEFIHKKIVYPYELGNLLDYVLENSIDINEYYDGERKKIIYDEKSNKLEEGYIYSKTELKKIKKI